MMLAWTIKAARRLAKATFPQLGREKQEVSLPPLLALPPELLEHMTTFLTQGETACLSLCNKRLRHQLGTFKRWDLLRLGRGHDDDRRYFLLQLARQDPSMFFCYDCSCLHLVDRVGPAIGGTRLVITKAYTSPRRPWCIAHPDWHKTPFHCLQNYDWSSSYSLTFSHVQLAMARYRDGPSHGIDLDMLSSKEVAHCTDGIVFLVAVEPVIAKDELLLRVQQWLVYDPDNPPKIPSFYGKPDICRHVNGFTSSLIERILHCKASSQQHNQSPRPRCTDTLWRCVRCTVEFELDAKKLEDGRQAVIITKWLNMGSGITPDDRQWQQHLKRLYPTWDFAQPISDDCSSIKYSFEQQAIKPQDPATTDSEWLLFSGAYRTEFRETWLGKTCRWLDQPDGM